MLSSLLGWLRFGLPRSARTWSPRQAGGALGVESLEDRCPCSAGVDPAVTPAPGGPRGRVHFDHLISAPKGDPAVVFLGDSILRGFARGPGKDVWQVEEGPLRAVDYAISGSTTQSVLWQVDHGQLDAISPRGIVLLIGTNN